MEFKIYSFKDRIPAALFENAYDLLRSSFPQNEIRTKAEQRKLLDNESYILLTLSEKNTLIGIMAIWDLSDFFFIEHFAVNEEYRSMGIGGKMLKYVKNTYNNPIVLEVELSDSTEKASRRIEFYKRHGFVFNEYEYFQPPMQEGFELLPLRIMSCPDALNEKEFLNIKDTLYTLVYRFFLKKDLIK